MISVPNRLGLMTSRDPRRIARSRSGVESRPPVLALRLGQHAQAVLDDDHGAVDDDAEVDRP